MANHCKPYKEQLVEHQKRLEEIRRNNELIRMLPVPAKEPTFVLHVSAERNHKRELLGRLV